MSEQSSPIGQSNPCRWTPDPWWAPADGLPLRWAAGEWSHAMSSLLAYASCWAYGRPQQFTNRMAYFLGRDVEVSAVTVHNGALLTDTNLYVISAQSAAMIVCRGTDPTNIIDFLTDLDNLLVPFHVPTDTQHEDCGYVHAGMYRAAREAEIDLLHCLEELDPKQIIIAGHSLGGGLAVMLAAILVARRFMRAEQVAVYTYGQPMIGDKGFRTYFDKSLALQNRTFRHVYRRDPVPRIARQDFTHPGIEYLVPPDAPPGEDRYVCRGATMPKAIAVPFWPAVAWSMSGFVIRRYGGALGARLAASSRLFPVILDDHIPDNYNRSHPAQPFRPARADLRTLHDVH